MDSETWLSAKKAVEMGFCDGILYEESKQEPEDSFIFNRLTVVNSLMKMIHKPGTEYAQLKKRLELIGGMIK
jgi:ATP-dependent Clp protease protease subunit